MRFMLRLPISKALYEPHEFVSPDSDRSIYVNDADATASDELIDLASA